MREFGLKEWFHRALPADGWAVGREARPTDRRASAWWVGLRARRLTLILLCAVLPLGAAERPRLTMPPGLMVRGAIEAEALLADAQRLLPRGAYLGPLLDHRYAVIDHTWLEREFMPAYRIATAELFAVAAETGDASDCDSFGMFLRQMIGLAGVIGRTEEPAAAQMIVLQDAAFSGVERTRENHSVGLVLTERGWFVLEPQNAVELIPFDRYPNRRNLRFITFH